MTTKKCSSCRFNLSVEDAEKICIYCYRKNLWQAQPTKEKIIEEYEKIKKDAQIKAIKEGLDKAKKRGRKLGRKEIAAAKIKKVHKLLLEGLTHREIKEQLGVSVGSITKYRKSMPL